MPVYLTSKNRIPYGSYWYYTDPYSKREIRAITWDSLMTAIYADRKSNGNPIGLGLEDEVEQYVCIRQPDECENAVLGAPRKRTLTLTDIINGTSVMLNFKRNGSEIVSREEAERRAQICISCPWNQTFAKPCTGICQELKSIVSWIIDSQGTQYDSRLHSCGVCGCFLQASIWLRLEDQCVGVTDDMKEQFKAIPECWKKCV